MNGIFCKLYIKAIIREAIEIKIYEKAGMITITKYSDANNFCYNHRIMLDIDIKKMKHRY